MKRIYAVVRLDRNDKEEGVIVSFWPSSSAVGAAKFTFPAQYLARDRAMELARTYPGQIYGIVQLIEAMVVEPPKPTQPPVTSIRVED